MRGLKKGNIALKLHVVSICFKCFRSTFAGVSYRCYKSMLKCCTCCNVIFKCMFQMFHRFQTYIVSVSSGCCKSRSECCIYMHVANEYFKCFKYFVRMLHMFCNGYKSCFSGALDVCCKCFNCFRRILQVFI
jgi:hypothetical protein